MRQSVLILLINPKKQVLLALRDNKSSIVYPNHWSGIGGGIEENEAAIEALEREIKEEISCEVHNIKPLGEMIDSSVTCRVIIFKGELHEELENIDLYEGQRLGLFYFEELNDILIPPPVKDFIFKNKEKIFN